MVIRNQTGQIVLNIIFILLAVSAVAPFLLLAASYLSSEAALAKYGYGFLPREFTLNAYTYLLKSGMKIIRGYGITILVTLIGTVCSVAMTILFVYPLSRKELPYQKQPAGADCFRTFTECILRYHDAVFLYRKYSGCIN